jgi:hypothetical protein
MTKTKKRPGPKPKLLSLYPHTFDEVVDTLLTGKPKKAQKEQEKEEAEERQGKSKEKRA